MSELSKWNGRELKPEEEAEYLKDLCAYLREQQTLSEPKMNEDGIMTCEVVPDEIAAHAADVIEELWGRLEEQYKEGILKGMQIKEGEYEHEQEILKGMGIKEVIDKVVAAEREACARVCEETNSASFRETGCPAEGGECAAAIRARGE